jgi:NADH-quinone oxidoreductase subunit M
MTQAPLSIFVFLPFLLAALVLLIPSYMDRLLKFIMVGGMLTMLGIALNILLQYNPALAENQSWMGYQLVEKADWISLKLGAFGALSIDYLLGVDGLSIAFIPLSALVLLIASLSALQIKEKVKGFVLAFLLMAGSIAGCFVALDFFLFFIFFEFMLLPMFFLIGLWGGKSKEKAAIKFFLYTLAGSVFILMGMIALYMSSIDPVETALNFGLLQPGELLTREVVFEIQQLLAGGSIPAEQIVHSFSFPYLSDSSNLIPYSVLSFESASSLFGLPLRHWCFFLLMLGFLIKLPSVPVHTWLPDAHVEAPTSVSLVLAGLLLKVGAYGLFRIVLPVFPELLVQYAFPLSVLGLISLLYGGLNALGSTDLKRLIAYSSVSHMGYVLIGLASLTAEGLSGALFQCISHGLISPFLFVTAGVLYDRAQNRDRDDFAGLVHPMPHFVAFALLGFFASMGIPFFSGFIGEILVLIGAFTSAGFNQLIPRWIALLAGSGMFLSAVYFLYTARKMFFGEFWTRDLKIRDQLKDLNFREYLMLLPLLMLIIMLGIYPRLLMQYLEPAVAKMCEMVQGL